MTTMQEMDLEFMDTIFRENIPYSGSLELTHRCNLACRHCYQFPPREGELDTSAWRRILEELADAGCLFLALTGGEPLLREDLLDLLLHAAQLHFAVTLQTNAVLLDGEKVRVLAEIPGLRVDVSLYGARPSTHDGLTGMEGSFAATLRALELLRRWEIPTLLKVTVGGFNLEELEDIAALADGLGMRAVFSALIFPRNDGDPAPTALRLDDGELERFMLFETRYMLERYGELLGDEERPTTRDLISSLQRCIVDHAAGGREKRRSCGAGRTIFTVNPYGDVYPCIAFPLVVGSLREESFGRIWKTSRELGRLRESEEELSEACRGCEMLGVCATCRALTFLETGRAESYSAERCRQTRIMLKAMAHGREERDEG